MASSLPSSANEYMFSRAENDSIRLNYHHFAVRQISGYLLHPSIPKQNSRSIRVADIGCGTGIWAAELALELSGSVEIDGFDIAAAQFPPKELMSDAVQFHVHDAFAPFPQKFLGTYDIVHIRFLLTLVNSENIVPLLQNLTALLKPGGYLQWFELDMLSQKAVAPRPDVSKAATEVMVEKMKKPTPHSEYKWVVQLDKIFSNNMLEEAILHEVIVDKSQRLLLAHVHLMTFEDICSKLETVGKVEEATVDRKLIARIRGELMLGVYTSANYLCAVGRKSL